MITIIIYDKTMMMMAAAFKHNTSGQAAGVLMMRLPVERQYKHARDSITVNARVDQRVNKTSAVQLVLIKLLFRCTLPQSFIPDARMMVRTGLKPSAID
ncbi:hypothetical protein EVAR_16020_1 [Eumeta japonica]|uniref:Uncharacterized protein n=1 Tax=Eumeta variegata TaxID=151549 RepID=A0A4C1VW36_EUMVA|nr:hypothetical protein EVAR_16020_1 [Eumeta japonica]